MADRTLSLRDKNLQDLVPLRIIDNGDSSFSLAVGAGSTSASLGQVGGYTRQISAAITRPADTTAYADGDGITDSTSAPTVLELTSAARVAAGSLLAVAWKLTKSTTTTTNASFRLWVYTASPTGGAPNDNAAFSPAVYADRATLLGYVDFATWLVGSDGAVCWGVPVLNNLPAKLPAGTSLYGILQAKAAYVPGSAEVFHIQIGLFQD